MFRLLIAMTLLAMLAACGDDSGGDDGGEDLSETPDGGFTDPAGDEAPAQRVEIVYVDDAGAPEGREVGVVWSCVCRGMLEVDGGAPRTSHEDIEHCATEDPTEMLSDRYDMAARESGPGRSGLCESCESTEDACVVQEE